MNKGNKLYEGKAKIIYETKDKNLVIQHFKDDATAFKNLKKAKVEGKGVLNNRISEYILTNLSQCGIKTHFVKRLNMREQLIKKAEIFPIEFIIRNIATGSLTKRLGIPEGTVLEKDMEDYLFTNLLDGMCGSFMAQTSDEICKRKGVTREETDEFAALSHKRTANSIDNGIWEQEIVNVGDIGHKDEDHVVRGSTPESLAELRTAFGPESLVTAGNASGVVDGAAAVVIKSASTASADGDTPLARRLSWGIVGLEPAIMAYGPVPSSRKALEKAGLTIDDIDRWEINEAFAGQAVACVKDLGLDIEKVNVNGGAVGIGHPLAATGTRLVLTLAHELKRSNGRYGVATACIGGGQGIAMVIESI